MKKSQKKNNAGKSKQEQLQQRAKQQEILLELARDLAETLDLNKVLERITKAAKEILHAHAIAIYLPANDGKTLQPVAAIDPQFEKEILAESIPIDSSLTGRAMKAKKTLIFNDAGVNSAGYQIPGTSEEKLESVMVTPFVANDRVLGAMCLNRLENNFNEADRTLAEIFAMHATNVLRNAQIHQSLQQEMEERRRVEKELQASEERFRIIFGYAPDAIYINDLMGEFIDGNRAAERLTGYSKEELIGKNLMKAKLLPLKQTLKAAKLLAKNAMGKPTGPDEFVLSRKDGSLIPVEIRTYPVRIGKKTVVLAIARDISTRKLAEKALKESEEKYRAVLHQSTDSIFLLDLHSKKVIEANASLLNLLGYSHKEMKKLTIYDFVADSQMDIDKEIESLRKSDCSSFVEHTYKAKDGATIQVEISASFVTYHNKEVLCFVSRDIGQRKSIEKQKKRIYELLMQSQKMESIGRLAGGIAHEFNNLLTGVIGFGELLLNQIGGSSPLRGDVMSIIGAAKQAASLAHQLLAFSRKKKMEFRPLDLNKIIRGMKHMLKNLIGENVNIDYHLDPSIPTMDSDPGLIEQIIINLAANACDAMAKGGILTISTRNILFNTKDLENLPAVRAGNFVSLIISDTGVGMNEEIIHRMFEPFFGTKIVGEGVGLGLSVVYGIVKQHGGWIDVESEKGKGSQFNIFLPATEAVIKPAGKGGKGKEKNFGNGESILVVEDEEIVRELASRVLRENDYVVFEAANSTEARDIFSREKGNFDLVFSDVIMPDENGPQLVDQLLLSRPHLKALFCSGYSDEKSQRAIIAEKGFPFLQKPYTPSDLLLAVREIMMQQDSYGFRSL